VIIPEHAPEMWTNLFTGEVYSVNNQISLDKVFSSFPVAVLTSDSTPC